VKNESKRGTSRSAKGEPAVFHGVPAAGGWSVKTSSNDRHHLFATQEEAEAAARQILRKQGGKLRVRGKDGRIRDTFTIGRDPFAKISALEGIHLTDRMKRDLEDFDRRKLSSRERQREIGEKYGNRRD
jgi:hypothetical protein